MLKINQWCPHEDSWHKIPWVNIIESFVCFFFAASQHDVILNPGDHVILKHPFNKLVQDIRRDQFVDVCLGKIFCKGLQKKLRLTDILMNERLTNNISNKAIFIPQLS
jgi:hypothetical protein